jgi:hypothetical protein
MMSASRGYRQETQNQVKPPLDSLQSVVHADRGKAENMVGKVASHAREP